MFVWITTTTNALIIQNPIIIDAVSKTALCTSISCGILTFGIITYTSNAFISIANRLFPHYASTMRASNFSRGDDNCCIEAYSTSTIGMTNIFTSRTVTLGFSGSYFTTFDGIYISFATVYDILYIYYTVFIRKKCSIHYLHYGTFDKFLLHPGILVYSHQCNQLHFHKLFAFHKLPVLYFGKQHHSRTLVGLYHYHQCSIRHIGIQCPLWGHLVPNVQSRQ